MIFPPIRCKYFLTSLGNTGLFKMIVGFLTTCHTQHTWDRSICVFLFNRTTLPVFVTYLTGALYVHRLWFYKHKHDNRVRSKLSVACQRWLFQWQFWFVPSVPDTHAPCLLKMCIAPSNGIVRWRLFPEFGAELPLDCTPTIIWITLYWVLKKGPDQCSSLLFNCYFVNQLVNRPVNTSIENE